MDVATVLTVAQTLFATLECEEVRKLCSIMNYESELQKLLDTVNTIKNFLMDADCKCQELTNEGQFWVQNLKDVVYDADDLLDEFNTVAHQLKKMPGGKVMKKVRRFFSSNNQLMFAVNKSKEVKNLREKLGRLAEDHSKFGFSELYKPVKIREETCSYVYEHDIIGRDADKEALVDLLLQDDSEKSNISFVTIVGIGGLGKTALAQLVFSDYRIKEAFKKHMYWVCVSENFDLKCILGKMIWSKEKKVDEFEDLQREVQKQIKGERYLLVLDDVWSESGMKWDELREYLMLGERGTRILVTSRSRRVARAIGNYPIHELRGLSDEDSWVLFKRVSLGQREDEDVTSLVEIGKEIVRKCANVPLSIRVIASLLRNQDIATWKSFRSKELANMCDDEDRIMPTLMFSYYHLSPELKSCFSFCSLFPEDCRIEKTKLIQLWMAQGFLGFNDETESMEDVGEKYVSILLHRCFFQDIKRNMLGEVYSFKMHDLMHELARKVARTTFPDCTNNDSERKLRHLYIDSTQGLTTWFRSSKTLRTCLDGNGITASDVDAIISNCCRLRVLDLAFSLKIEKLPDTIGNLLHLRYLDLSHNQELEMLPNSITKLHNLQILKLSICLKLKELPKDTNKLVNLRVLDIATCVSLSHMPEGMGTLTCLHTLTMFIVSGDDDDVKKGKLTDLIPLLHNLRGQLFITDNANSSNYIACMFVELKTIKLRCYIRCHHTNHQETMLESLFVAFECQELRLECNQYLGTKMPSWPSGLVSITLTDFIELEYLPSSLSQLCHLKYLFLCRISKVEYIESDAPSPLAKFFPSLEKLILCDMPALKKWMENEAVCIPSFPRLSYLEIVDCRELRNIPPFPEVKELYLYKFNEALANSMKTEIAQSYPIRLERLGTDNLCIYNSLGWEFSRCDVSIELRDIENLGTNREGFQRCASSLRDLTIRKCREMEKLGIEHLTNLKSLTLSRNIEGIPWKSLHYLSSLEIYIFKQVTLPKGIQYLTSLQSLVLNYCVEITSLPEEMRCLTSLSTLQICNCPKLESLPEAIKHLTSLNKLTIQYPNSELENRCRKSDGEDWPKICHIPNLHITE